MRALVLLALTLPPARAGVEQRIIAATNAQRLQRGLPLLKEDERLDKAALGHSMDMLKRRRLTHDSKLKGLETPAKRASAAGVAWRMVAENVAFYEGYRPSGGQVVDDWMHSPHHRANIVAADARLIGVATACDGNDCYVTQMFAAER